MSQARAQGGKGETLARSEVAKAYGEVIDVIRSVVSTALRKGEAGEEVYETLFEEVEVGGDEDLWTLYYVDILSTLSEILEAAGLKCSLYFRKDDVPGYEYVANCTTRRGRSVALGLDVVYDNESGTVDLVYVHAWGNKEWEPSWLVYYVWV